MARRLRPGASSSGNRTTPRGTPKRREKMHIEGKPSVSGQSSYVQGLEVGSFVQRAKVVRSTLQEAGLFVQITGTGGGKVSMVPISSSLRF